MSTFLIITLCIIAVLAAEELVTLLVLLLLGGYFAVRLLKAAHYINNFEYLKKGENDAESDGKETQAG